MAYPKPIITWQHKATHLLYHLYAVEKEIEAFIARLERAIDDRNESAYKQIKEEVDKR